MESRIQGFQFSTINAPILIQHSISFFSILSIKYTSNVESHVIFLVKIMAKIIILLTILISNTSLAAKGALAYRLQNQKSLSGGILSNVR